MSINKAFLFRYSVLTITLLLGFFLLFNESSDACTTFCMKDGNALIFGNNFDFPAGTAKVLINKRGVSKTALIRPPLDIPASWVSKYGSITFNQVGWDFPYQGMNEAGLVVAQLLFDGTIYSNRDQRSAVTELQWIQYQLDTAKSTEEVIASDKNIRIAENNVPLHFLVCDRSGKIAAIEFINGKQVVSYGDSLPYPVLTNNLYSEAAALTEEYKGRLNDIPKTAGRGQRFAKTVYLLNNYKNQKSVVDYAFDILKEVSAPQNGTKYSIVFDLKNEKINYRSLNNEKIRSLQMKDFDFSCKSPVLGVDIDSDIPKGKDDFQIFTIDINRILIEKTITEFEYLNQLIGPIKEFYITYPQSMFCADSGK